MNRDLGFYLRQDERGDWLYCEDGEERYATLPERVLWQALAATPAAEQRPALVALTGKQVKALLSEAGYDNAPAQQRADFINGLRHREVVHGITAPKAKEGE